MYVTITCLLLCVVVTQPISILEETLTLPLVALHTTPPSLPSPTSVCMQSHHFLVRGGGVLNNSVQAHHSAYPPNSRRIWFTITLELQNMY